MQQQTKKESYSWNHSSEFKVDWMQQLPVINCTSVILKARDNHSSHAVKFTWMIFLSHRGKARKSINALFSTYREMTLLAFLCRGNAEITAKDSGEVCALLPPHSRPRGSLAWLDPNSSTQFSLSVLLQFCCSYSPESCPDPDIKS